MRIAILAAVTALATACTPVVVAEPEAEFMMTGPIPVEPGGS